MSLTRDGEVVRAPTVAPTNDGFGWAPRFGERVDALVSTA